MDNNDVVKNALAAASAKAGFKSAKDFLKTKGVESAPEKVEKVEKAEARKEAYCDRTCQRGVSVPQAHAEPVLERKRLVPIWPLPNDQTPEEYMAQLVLERAAEAKKREAFLKEIDSPEHLAKVRATAIEAVGKIPVRHIPIQAASKKEEKAEKKEAKAKAKAEKKDSGRQNRLGQTKLIDELIKSGKSEKEIFDAVRIKIPAYPADKLPKLIKLRQYHVKK